MENEVKATPNEVEILKQAIEHRATWFALLIEEAGGLFTMPYEAETDFGKPACILAANPQCLAPAHEILMRARDYIEKEN